VRSAPGWQHELTSERFVHVSEVVMPRTLSSTDLTQRSRHVVTSRFRCSTAHGAGKASWVNTAGELDVAVAPLFQQVLHEAAQRSRLVVVDLRAVTRVDSSGVGALVRASVNAQRSGCRVVVIRGLSQVDRLLALTGDTNAVETIDLTAGEPARQALLHINREGEPRGMASRVARRVVTFMPRHHPTRRHRELKSTNSGLTAPVDSSAGGRAPI
jgi:anti-anti-sigma factor